MKPYKNGYQIFGGIRCLNFQGRNMSVRLVTVLEANLRNSVLNSRSASILRIVSCILAG